MFCPQCGATNADNAPVCVQCGRNLQPSMTPPVQAAPLPVTGVVIPPGAVAPSNYLVFAILATVLCCLPAGIPAIVYAAQVNSKLQLGDLAGAQAASNNAKLWCWISFGLGLATIGASMLMFMLGIIGSLHQH
jgi:hypothetical protein